MISSDEKFIKELRKRIICEARKEIREEWYKKNPKPSFYEDWAKHQKGQIKIILDTMKRVNKNLRIIDIEILRDLEKYYQESISRQIYYDYIFSTIKKIKKFHKLRLEDDTYDNRRKTYFNALLVVNECNDDEVFPQFPPTRISAYHILEFTLRAYHLNEENRIDIFKLIKYHFDRKSNGERYKDNHTIRKLSSKKTKFEKEQYEAFKKIFNINITRREV